MRLITRADVDAAATFAMCARLGNARRVMEGLRDRFEDPGAAPEVVLEYGLCRAVYLLNDPNDTDKGPHQVAAVRAFTRCLDLDARWWLPRFLRIELTSVLIGSVPGHDLGPPEPDVDTLLSYQDGVAEPPPYFASTHAARLRARLRQDQPDGTDDIGAAVDEFVAAASGATRVPFVFPYLDLPFRESVVLLRHHGRADAAEAVKAVGLAVYPESLSLQFT